MQDGLDELNLEFSKLVAVTSKEFSVAMGPAGILYQQMLDFDMFISEGVLGRRLSSEAEWKRVQKQVSDIREERVANYATLTDFLERGLAAAVADIARFAGRYENLRNRVRDHMSRMRTELSAENTAQIVHVLDSSRKLGVASEQLLRGVGNEVKQSKALARQQTKFLRNADILVVIGAVYYLRNLLNEVLKRSGYEAGTGWPAVFQELGLIAGLVVIVVVTKLYAHRVFRSIARSFRQIYNRVHGYSQAG